jgi:hypothetical protein
MTNSSIGKLIALLLLAAQPSSAADFESTADLWDSTPGWTRLKPSQAQGPDLVRLDSVENGLLATRTPAQALTNPTPVNPAWPAAVGQFDRYELATRPLAD